MKTFSFVKYEALGNDFVLIDIRHEKFSFSKKQIKKIADRKLGIGCDQVILIVSPQSKNSHVSIQFYNADGGEAEMCGNGLRAAAAYLWQHEDMKAKTLVFETKAGIRKASKFGQSIKCEMGAPKILKLPSRLKIISTALKYPIFIDSSVPHLVFLVAFKNISEKKLAAFGSYYEYNKIFPKRTNVDFVDIRSAHELHVKVWERGVGFTRACGTGAVAAAVACLSKGLLKNPVTLFFPGGKLLVEWQGSNTPAYLTGPIKEVFAGVFAARAKPSKDGNKFVN